MRVDKCALALGDIYNRLKRDIIEILKTLIQRKPDVRIIEGEACPDHIHMLLEIPPKYSAAEIMGYLKSKSTLMVFNRHANLKYKYGNRHFQARGYFLDTVGKNEKVIREYIQNQLQEDKLADQMSMKEFIDPFTGEPVKEGKGKDPFKGQPVKKLRLSVLQKTNVYRNTMPLQGESIPRLLGVVM